MAVIDFPELIPNGRDKGGDPATAHLADYYSRLGQWADAALEEGVASQKEVPELKEISTALDYLCGLQWKEAMPSYRARPVSNEILAMFWETIGLLTDIKPMFQITDIGGEGAYSPIQSILNKLAKGWAANSRFERTLAFATMFGMLTTATSRLPIRATAASTCRRPTTRVGSGCLTTCPSR